MHWCAYSHLRVCPLLFSACLYRPLPPSPPSPCYPARGREKKKKIPTCSASASEDSAERADSTPSSTGPNGITRSCGAWAWAWDAKSQTHKRGGGVARVSVQQASYWRWTRAMSLSTIQHYDTPARAPSERPVHTHNHENIGSSASLRDRRHFTVPHCGGRGAGSGYTLPTLAVTACSITAAQPKNEQRTPSDTAAAAQSMTFVTRSPCDCCPKGEGRRQAQVTHMRAAGGPLRTKGSGETKNRYQKVRSGSTTQGCYPGWCTTTPRVHAKHMLEVGESGACKLPCAARTPLCNGRSPPPLPKHARAGCAFASASNQP
jgi:hypothetical protein